jgi:hypothetical protein
VTVEAVEDCPLVAEHEACGGKEVPAPTVEYNDGDNRTIRRD